MKQKILKKLYVILAYFARKYLNKSNPFIIGVTGSVGKTSCRMIVTQVLRIIEKQSYEIKKDSNNYQRRINELIESTNYLFYTSPKNFNSEIGLILSIFQIEEYSASFFGLLKAIFSVIYKSLVSKPWYKVIVLEYGIDHPGDMDFLLTIAKPDIAIFTKLDKVHSEFFNDNIEDIGDEKFKLILSAKKQVYLNYGDDYCKNNASKVKVPVKYFFGGDVTVNNLQINEKANELSTTFMFNDQEVKTNLFGEENINYIALGLDIANYIEGKNIENLNSIYFNLSLQAGRFTLLSGINHSVLVDSTYNASPESMKKMILNTFSLRDKIFKKYKIGFVIGDMRELGDLSEDSHNEIALYLEKADLVYAIGKETNTYLVPELTGKIENIKSFKTSKQAGIELKNFIEEQTDEYIILFKGSQNTIFTEEALKQLLSHKIDEKKLVRQSRDWMRNKEDFFDKNSL